MVGPPFRSGLSAGGREERLDPGGVFAGRGRIGLVLVDKEPVARLVVDPVDDRPEVETGVGLADAEGDGHGRQWVAEAERPESGAWTLPGSTDEDRVGAGRTV